MEIVDLLIRVFAGAVIGWFLATTIHELGHVLCGLLHHWKLSMLVIGPFKLYREKPEDKIRFGIEKNPVLWGGVGGTFPASQSADDVRIWSEILLAGPLTSLIFGVLTVPVCILMRSLIMLMLCLMLFAMGLVTILPMQMKTGLLYNDGTRYMRIRSGGQEAAEETALLLLMEVTLFGDADSTYPEKLIEPLRNSKDPELNYYGCYYAYRNAVREQNPEQIELLLDQMDALKDRVPKIIQDDCRLDA